MDFCENADVRIVSEFLFSARQGKLQTIKRHLKI